jgi:hypothetical protein
VQFLVVYEETSSRLKGFLDPDVTAASKLIIAGCALHGMKGKTFLEGIPPWFASPFRNLLAKE